MYTYIHSFSLSLSLSIYLFIYLYISFLLSSKSALLLCFQQLSYQHIFIRKLLSLTSLTCLSSSGDSGALKHRTWKAWSSSSFNMPMQCTHVIQKWVEGAVEKTEYLGGEKMILISSVYYALSLSRSLYFIFSFFLYFFLSFFLSFCGAHKIHQSHSPPREQKENAPLSLPMHRPSLSRSHILNMRVRAFMAAGLRLCILLG